MTTLTEKIYQDQRDIEQLFAAAAYIAPDYVVETCGWLRPEILRDERIKKFWGLILDGSSQYDASFETGLQTEILKWVVSIPTSMGARDYAKHIAKQNYLAGLSTQLNLLAQAIGNQDAESARGIIDEMASERLQGVSLVHSVEEIQTEFIDAIVKENRSILTGIPGIDNHTGGFERQTLSVIAGRPSMGKSAMILQIARNAAGPGRKKVLIFSLEMSRVNMWARAACPKAGVTWLDVKAKKLTQDQETRLFQESAELAAYYGKNLLIDDKRQTTDSIWQTVTDTRPDLVFVDHMRLIKDKGDNEVKRQGMISERLKDMAKELDCHVCTAAQLNRSVEMRNDKRPLLSDLRDSGEIEENADQVMMLYRDSYYHQSSDYGDMSETELWLRKFRDGVRNARVRLAFYEEKQWFEPWPY